MPTQVDFKSAFNVALVKDLGRRVRLACSFFDAQAFELAVPVLGDLAMKQRVRAISNTLQASLPANYVDALNIVMQAVSSNVSIGQPELRGFPAWVPLQFVEDFGLSSFSESIHAMELLTQQFSAEFAIRPYLLQHTEQTLAVLHGWCNHDSSQVRRLVSEGTRPRLPWGQQLPPFISDPAPVFALLGKLLDDPSEFVRRSVANNLNDIAKDNPHLVVERLNVWRNGRENSSNFQWICRHALRTLIKNGDAGALALLGYHNDVAVRVGRFEVTPSVLSLGARLELICEMNSTAQQDQRVVVDYAIHFQKKRGTSRRVFKWSNKTLEPHKTLTLLKRHAVVPVSVRTYYSGEHRIDLLVNGNVVGSSSFQLSA